MELTDEDQLAIEACFLMEGRSSTNIYLAGMRAGIERAALAAWTVRGLPSNPVEVRAMCVAAIRTLITPSPEAP